MFRIAGENADGSIAVSGGDFIVDVYVHSPYAANRGAIMPAWAWTASVGGTDLHSLTEADREVVRDAMEWLAQELPAPADIL